MTGVLSGQSYRTIVLKGACVPPTAEQGHEVRQRLLAAAVELIPERGWTAVSTRVLADRAGVSPSVVHYHFASVTALLNEAVVTTMRAVLEQATAFLDTARTPDEVVDALIGAVDQYSGADPMSLLFVEAYLAGTRDEDLHRQLGAVVDTLRGRLADWFTVHAVPEPAQTAAVLAAAIDGILLHRGLGAGLTGEASAKVLRRLVS